MELKNAQCPRCGYDLGGEIASWTDRSPMRGICSECGLGFAWGEVLHPTRSMPRWAIEHPMGFVVSRAASCFVRALWPWTFWKKIRIEQPIKLRALVWFAVAMLAGMHLVVGSMAAVRTYVDIGRWLNRLGTITLPPPPQRVFDALPSLVWPYSNPLSWSWGYEDLGTITLTILAVLVAMPMGFLVLGRTMAKAKVRWVHLVRAFVLTMPIGIVGIVIAWSMVLFERALLQREYYSVFAAMAGTILVHAAAWWVIVRRYLRLERAVGVSIAMTLIAWLAGMVVTAWAPWFLW